MLAPSHIFYHYDLKCTDGVTVSQIGFRGIFHCLKQCSCYASHVIWPR